jgi:hypothetical protein
MSNTRTTRDVAHDFVDLLPDKVFGPFRGLAPDGNDAVTILADELQAFIAEVVASVIDAGSERDAVMEDVDLNTALIAHLEGWLR